MKKKAAELTKELVQKGKGFVTAHVVDTDGSSPGKRGAFMVMAESGEWAGTVGGGALEAEVQKIAIGSFGRKQPFVKTFILTKDQHAKLDMRCGGTIHVRIEYNRPENGEAFLRTLGNPEKVYVFGCGHIGKSLEPLLRFVSFAPIMIDDRKEYSSVDNFPQAEDVITLPSFDVAYDFIKTDARSFIVIVTRGHAADYEVLKQALQYPYAYIGMIGSKSKTAEIYAKLEADGFSRELLSTVHAPIGLPIGGNSPEEIAVSIVSEMIQVRCSLEGNHG